MRPTGNKDTRVLVSQQSYLVHHGGYAGDRGGLCPEYARSEAHRKDTKGASVFDFGGGKPTLRTDDYIDTGYRASQSTKDAPKARATLLFPWNNRRLGDRLTCGPEIDACTRRGISPRPDCSAASASIFLHLSSRRDRVLPSLFLGTVRSE